MTPLGRDEIREAVVEVLERRRVGYVADEAALRRDYPLCWREILDLLAVEDRLERLSSRSPRP